jgi:peptide/nickel transport system ATP-binding protein
MSRPELAADAIVSVRNLSKHFPTRRKLGARPTAALRVLQDVSFDIFDGETLGLVGESGSGKTTLGRCVIGILPPNAGSIAYRRRDGEIVDITTLSRHELQICQREIRMVFQDPFSSLNPRMTLLQIVGDPLIVNKLASGSALEDRVAAMIRKVGLSPDMLRRYPHAFSGGERQRINIARALIMEPRLVIADEAVSALDVSIRATILDLMKSLQDELKLTYLFISHDLSVVEGICDRVAVMNQGEIVELASTADLYRRPQHDYTKALLSAVPIPDPRLRPLRAAAAP